MITYSARYEATSSRNTANAPYNSRNGAASDNEIIIPSVTADARCASLSPLVILFSILLFSFLIIDYIANNATNAVGLDCACLFPIDKGLP